MEQQPNQMFRVRGNWLTRKVNPNAFFVASTSVLVLVLASLFYWNNVFQAGTWMTAIPQNVFHSHEYWRLFTALLAHADLGHLISNSLLFFIFAYFLYGHFGLLIFPGAALIFGALTNAVVLTSLPPTAELLGASGVVYWMGASWLTLYLCLETRERRTRRILKAIGIAILLFAPETFHQEVSYLSHFVGFVFGILWTFPYYFWNRRRFQRAEVIEIVDENE